MKMLFTEIALANVDRKGLVNDRKCGGCVYVSLLHRFLHVGASVFS
jgi:hypothetical protein